MFHENIIENGQYIYIYIYIYIFRFEQKEGFFKINSERVFHGDFHGNLSE